MMKTCDTCRANKVCDHECYGFEDCGNHIPENIFKRLFQWLKSFRKRKYKVIHSETKPVSDFMRLLYDETLIDSAMGLGNDGAFKPREMNTGAKVEFRKFKPLTNDDETKSEVEESV